MTKGLSSIPILTSSARVSWVSSRPSHQICRIQACLNSNWAVRTNIHHANGSNPAREERVLQHRPLARLPTSQILRTLFLGLFFTSPFLFKPGLSSFSKIANSTSSLLNPDKNRLLNAVLRPLVYDQFCAGANAKEIAKTSAIIKNLGFSGVVLCYGKEVQLGAGNEFYGYTAKGASIEAEVQQWLEGNLQTLQMVGKGDWLGIKYTGAGLQVTQALMKGEAMPESFRRAITEICSQAAVKDCRVWIDAEQQRIQSTIDSWTFELMRAFNQNGKAVVYSTIQAYLKSSRQKVERQLSLAAAEGWHSAMKLVRGAYIANDQRELIHDTKAETDASYNGIVEDLLSGKGFAIFNSQPGLQFELLLAGHNTQTIRKAANLANELQVSDSLKVVPEFAQLQGMADDIGCELLQTADVSKTKVDAGEKAFVPKVYKCLTWGTTQECMQYLTRRLIENRGAADRMKEGASLLRQELFSRWRHSIGM